MHLLEFRAREDLNKNVTGSWLCKTLKKLNFISNYPDQQVEELELINNPENPDSGSRLVPFLKRFI